MSNEFKIKNGFLIGDTIDGESLPISGVSDNISTALATDIVTGLSVQEALATKADVPTMEGYGSCAIGETYLARGLTEGGATAFSSDDIKWLGNPVSDLVYNVDGSMFFDPTGTSNDDIEFYSQGSIIDMTKVKSFHMKYTKEQMFDGTRPSKLTWNWQSEFNWVTSANYKISIYIDGNLKQGTTVFAQPDSSDWEVDVVIDGATTTVTVTVTQGATIETVQHTGTTSGDNTIGIAYNQADNAYGITFNELYVVGTDFESDCLGNEETYVTTTDFNTALEDKADKVSGATDGNLAALNSNGNLTDSGFEVDDDNTDDDILWSADKITTELALKADVATSDGYANCPISGTYLSRGLTADGATAFTSVDFDYKFSTDYTFNGDGSVDLDPLGITSNRQYSIFRANGSNVDVYDLTFARIKWTDPDAQPDSGANSLNIGGSLTSNTRTGLIGGVLATYFNGSRVDGSVTFVNNVPADFVVELDFNTPGQLTMTTTVTQGVLTETLVRSGSFSPAETAINMYSYYNNSGVTITEAYFVGTGYESNCGGPSNYVTDDGAIPFTGPVGGVDPVADSDLATKNYIDGEIITLSGQIPTFNNIYESGNYILPTSDNISFGDEATSRWYQGSVSGLHAEWVHFEQSGGDDPTEEGAVWYNSDDHTLNLQTDVPDSILQLGQENWVRVLNNTGSDIGDGKIVYINGSQGQRATIQLTSAASEETQDIIGMTTHAIADGDQGWVTTFGLVRNLNTDVTGGDDAGATVWTSVTSGEWQTTQPDSPAHGSIVGTIVIESNGNGAIFVNPQNGFELYELHDVDNNLTATISGLYMRSNGVVWSSGYIAGNEVTYENFTSSLSSSNIQDAIDELAINAEGAVTNNGYNTESLANGEWQQDKVSMSFDPTGGTGGIGSFTIDAIDSTYEYYYRGAEKVMNKTTDAITVDIPTTAKSYWIYFSDAEGTLTVEAANTVNVYTIIRDNVFVAEIVWNKARDAAMKESFEFHGLMNWETHLYNHLATGTRYGNEGLLVVPVNNTKEISIGGGLIWDEDIRWNISDIPNAANNQISSVWYEYDAVTPEWDSDFFDSGVAIDGGGQPQYNDITDAIEPLKDVPNNNYVLYHYFGTLDFNNKEIFTVVGQNLYTARNAAREAAASEINTITTTGLTFPEYKALATAIVRGGNNTWDYEQVEGAAMIIDWRTSSIGTAVAGSIVDHGALTGLDDDDHTQYLLADGTRDVDGSLTVTGIATANTVEANTIRKDNNGPNIILTGDGTGSANMNFNGTTGAEYLQVDLGGNNALLINQTSVRLNDGSGASLLQRGADYTNLYSSTGERAITIRNTTDRVGVHNITPDTDFHVVGDSKFEGDVDITDDLDVAGVLTAGNFATADDRVTIAYGANAGVYVEAGASSVATLGLGDNVSSGKIAYDNATDSMAINTNDATRVTIDSTGDVDILRSLTVGGFFDLSGSVSVNDISTDTSFTTPTNTRLVTQSAIKSYVDSVNDSATFIDGTADEVQLKVQAHSTQTASNILEVESWNSTDLFTIDGAGNTEVFNDLTVDGEVIIGDGSSIGNPTGNAKVTLSSTGERVLIGTTTKSIEVSESYAAGINGNVFIDGRDDNVQLRVKGHSTQNQDILSVGDDGGNELFTVNNTGDVDISSDLDVGGRVVVGDGLGEANVAIESIVSNSGSNGSILALRNSAEAVDSANGVYLMTGTGALSNTNIHGIMQGVITQATPSALKGKLNFYVNGGDSLDIAMVMNDDKSIDMLGDADITNDLTVGGTLTVGDGVTASPAITIERKSGEASIAGATGKYLVMDSDAGTYINNYTASDVILGFGGGNVGIGTAIPDERLHVFSGSAGAIGASSVTDLVVENSSSTGLQFLSPSTSIQYMLFGDEASNTVGQITYNHNTDVMTFIANSNAGITIDNLGDVDILNGDLDVGGDADVGGVLTVGDATAAVINATCSNTNANSVLSLNTSNGATAGVMVAYGSASGAQSNDVSVKNTVTGGELDFWTQGTKKLSIESGPAGGVNVTNNLTVGGATIASSYPLIVKNNSVGAPALALERTASGTLFGYMFENTDTSGLLALKGTSTADTVNINGNGISYFNGGYIGVGLADPAQPLHVHNASSNTNLIKITNTDSGTDLYSGLGIGLSGPTTAYVLNYEDGDMFFGTGSVIGMVLDANNNLGIGTDTPSAELDVVGDVEITDDLDVGGDLAVGGDISGKDLTILPNTGNGWDASAVANGTLQIVNGSSIYRVPSILAKGSGISDIGLLIGAVTNNGMVDSDMIFTVREDDDSAGGKEHTTLAGKVAYSFRDYAKLLFEIDRDGDTRVYKDLAVSGDTDSATYSVGGTAGASGSFTSNDGKTITVTNGLITAMLSELG